MEVFAPVVFERHRLEVETHQERVVRGEGTLLLDALAFNVRAATRKQGGKRAFTSYTAMAYTGRNNNAKLPRLRAYRGAQTNMEAERVEFLDSLPGAPARVVCDNDGSLVRAVRSVWPSAELIICGWHRKQSLIKVLDQNGACGSRSEDAKTRTLGGPARARRRARGPDPAHRVGRVLRARPQAVHQAARPVHPPPRRGAPRPHRQATR